MEVSIMFDICTYCFLTLYDTVLTIMLVTINTLFRRKDNNMHLQISHVFLKVPDMIHNIIHNSIFRRHNLMIFSDTSWVIIAVVKLCAKISYNLWEIVANLAWKFENVHGHSKWSNKQYQYIPSITSNQDTSFFLVSLSVIYLDEN